MAQMSPLPYPFLGSQKAADETFRAAQGWVIGQTKGEKTVILNSENAISHRYL